MPYKVERGKVSFQCGTLSQKILEVQHLVLRQKLLPQYNFLFLLLYIYLESILKHIWFRVHEAEVNKLSNFLLHYISLINFILYILG